MKTCSSLNSLLSLIFNPSERGILEEIMRDPWINKGSEEELKPSFQLLPDYKDPKQNKLILSMSYKLEEIQDSLRGRKLDKVMTTNYWLLGYKAPQLEDYTINMMPCLQLMPPVTAVIPHLVRWNVGSLPRKQPSTAILTSTWLYHGKSVA